MVTMSIRSEPGATARKKPGTPPRARGGVQVVGSVHGAASQAKSQSRPMKLPLRGSARPMMAKGYLSLEMSAMSWSLLRPPVYAGRRLQLDHSRFALRMAYLYSDDVAATTCCSPPGPPTAARYSTWGDPS